MSSSQMAWHHAYSKVRIWLVDLLLQNNAFFVIFFKKCVREQLLDLIFVISTLQISQKPHPIIVYNNNNNNNNIIIIIIAITVTIIIIINMCNQGKPVSRIKVLKNITIVYMRLIFKPSCMVGALSCFLKFCFIFLHCTCKLRVI